MRDPGKFIRSLPVKRRLHIASVNKTDIIPASKLGSSITRRLDDPLPRLITLVQITQRCLSTLVYGPRLNIAEESPQRKRE